MTQKEVTLDNNFYIFECPHCDRTITVKQNELNCCIFRCGVYKNNFQQIPPHSKKEECDRLKDNDLIYGCGKPFKFNKQNNLVEICDYI